MAKALESDIETRIHSISSELLTPIVRRATGSSGQLNSWTCEPVHVTVGGLGASVIYRFSGSIQVQSQAIPWSMILKVLAQSFEKSGGHQNDPENDRREYEFYQSDLRHLFPAGFRTAHCYAQSIQQVNLVREQFWLWIEDLSSLMINPWNLGNNAQAAHALGKFNGAFLVDHPLPKAVWLNSNILRHYMDLVAPAFNRLFEQRDQPLVRRMYSPDIVDSLAEMWHRREEHLAVFDRLPQTLCHGDAQRTNLFLTSNETGQPETVAIDWGSIGVASIGLDLAQIFMLSIDLLDEAFTRALDRVLFENYLDGIRAVGWRGDSHWIRLGYTATMLKVRAAYVLRILPILTNDDTQPGPVKISLKNYFGSKGLSFEEGISNSAWVHAYVRELFEESLVLRKQLL